MATYVYEVYNPKTNRKLKVGSPTYRDLVKTGVLPEKTLLIIDGRTCIKADEVVGSSQSFSSKDEKVKALREYRSQLDEKKKKAKLEVKNQEALEMMQKLYIEEKQKNKLLKEKVKAKKKAPAKQIPKDDIRKKAEPKKEEHYEYDSSSDDSSLTSASGSAESA